MDHLQDIYMDVHYNVADDDGYVVRRSIRILVASISLCQIGQHMSASTRLS